MTDVGTSEFRESLRRAVKTSTDVLRPFRQRRKELIEAYIGSRWGDTEGARRETLVNLLWQAADVYVQALAANRPRILVKTQHPHLTGFAKRFQVATNNLIQEIHLEETLQLLVLDAFFSVGIAKVYLAPSGTVELPNPALAGTPPELNRSRESTEQLGQGIPPNIWVDPGTPMVERVSLDDFIFDTQATEWSRVRYACHEYRVPLAWVQEDDRFDQDVVKKLGPTSKWDGMSYSDGDGPVRELATHNRHDFDEIEPMVTLMDVWLPQEQKWLVCDNKLLMPPLLVQDWDGPEGGPFHLLSFGHVPDNIMPLSLSENLLPMQQLVNALWRKMARDAKNQKTIITYSGDDKGPRSARDARGNELVRVNNPDLIRPMAFPGADQGTMLVYQACRGEFSQLAGNLDAMAGLGPQADTATQDTLIHSAVSGRIAKLQATVVKFTGKICSDLGWMLWVDEQKQLAGSYREPGLTLPVEANWTPGEREGNFVDYNLSIEPFSMAYKPPSKQAQEILDVIDRLSANPAFMQAGGMLDFEKLADLLADYLDLPQLREIISFNGMPLLPEQSQEAQAPSETTRTYVRKNQAGGASPQGQRTQMMQAIMGARGQGGQPSMDIAG